jgi:hypothetical protein
MIARIAIDAALVLFLAWAGRKVWLNGHYHGLTKGMVLGYDNGDRYGYTEGYAIGQLDYVLAHPEPTEAQHYAAIVSAIPDAEHFADAVRMDTVRRSVQGKEPLS